NSHKIVALELYKGATFALWGGFIVSVFTALTGLWDWWKSSEPGTQARRTINAHAWTMVTATILVLLNLIMRTWMYDNAGHTPGRVLVLSLVVFVLIAIGGTIGGELTYDYGFNVETAGDSPVWAKSEADVMPDGSVRGGPTPVHDVARVRRWVSVFDWLPGYRRADLSGDLMAGLTGAAVLVPQSMAYAQIAHLPPVVGLYASVVPLLVYAVLGRVPQLGVGPLASISILSAVGVAKLAPDTTVKFITLSATLAIIAGAVHLAIGLARLGSLIRFLSEPVMTGFLAALAVLLIGTQLGALTGTHIPATSTRAYEVFRDWINGLDSASVTSAVFGAVAVAVLLVLRRWRRFPSALAMIIVSSLAVVLFNLDAHGVAIV